MRTLVNNLYLLNLTNENSQNFWKLNYLMKFISDARMISCPTAIRLVQTEIYILCTADTVSCLSKHEWLLPPQKQILYIVGNNKVPT